MKLLFKTILTGLIDYAGLFPPSQESMESAAAKYASYLAGDRTWALGRFIVPVSRLAELETAARDLEISKAWRLSALAGPNLAKDLDSIERFNDDQAGRLEIDTLETKVDGVESLEKFLAVVPAGITAYYEIPLSPAPAGYLAALRCSCGRAKIRTGGVTEDAFPSSEVLAAFLNLAAASTVPFKATAGLHHPIRGLNSLTYEPGSPRATMHGFLNLILAAAFVREGMEEDETRVLLDETDPAAFRFEQDTAAWRGWRLGAAQMAAMRTKLLITVGSCSFTEPTEGLEKLGLL
jgi:hypothetical protein